MFSSPLFVLIWLQLIISSAAVVLQPSGVLPLNATMSFSSELGAPSSFPVEGTRVTLKIDSTTGQPIPDRSMLMCAIEGMNILAKTDGGDPIEDHKVSYNYGTVKIVLEDRGTPTGRFINEIAGWTLRGLAEWMTRYDMFRELNAGVYFNHYYCGTATVTAQTLESDTASGTAVSTATTAAASNAGTGAVAAE